MASTAVTITVDCNSAAGSCTNIKNNDGSADVCTEVNSKCTCANNFADAGSAPVTPENSKCTTADLTCAKLG